MQLALRYTQVHFDYDLDLSRSRDVIGHVPIRLPYRYSIGTDTLSPRDFVILRLTCIWVTVMTSLLEN